MARKRRVRNCSPVASEPPEMARKRRARYCRSPVASGPPTDISDSSSDNSTETLAGSESPIREGRMAIASEEDEESANEPSDESANEPSDESADEPSDESDEASDEGNELSDESADGSNEEEDIPDEQEITQGDNSYLFRKPETRYIINRIAQSARDRLHPRSVSPRNKAFNHFFISSDASKRYESFTKRMFLDQKLLPDTLKDSTELVKILKDAELIYTAIDVRPYVIEIVREFYANLGETEQNGAVHHVYIRGKMFEFSADIINRLYGIVVPDDVLGFGPPKNGNVDSAIKLVTDRLRLRWEDMVEADFTHDMHALYQLCCFNWLPSFKRSNICKERLLFLQHIVTAGPLDFGHVVFKQMLSIARSPEDVGKFIPFPNLVYQLLCFQRNPDDLYYKGDTWSKDPVPFPMLTNRNNKERLISYSRASIYSKRRCRY